MPRKMLLAALLPILALACAQGTGESEGYSATVLLLPEGDEERGKTAFVSLGCAACHTVAWDADLPAPSAGTPAPELGLDVDSLGPGGLATSIVAPSHKVAEKYGDGTSPMADFSGTLTVRQLSDIVAYLTRQGMESKARTVAQ
ncbi:MAG: cytochrome c [bacterium]|nr:cytochrome c [bacterium]